MRRHTELGPASVLLALVIYSYGLGQLGGYLVSSLVLGKSYLYAAVPLMNVASWFAVYASLGFVIIRFLGPGFDARASGGLFFPFYLILAGVALIAFPVGLIHEWPVIGIGADVVYLLGSVVIYFVARLTLRLRSYLPAMDRSLLRQWLFAAVFWAVASTLCSFAGITSGALGAHFPSVLIVSLFYYVAFDVRIGEIAILVLPLLLQIKEMNRTTILQLAAAVVQFTIAGGGARMVLRMLVVALPLGVVALAATESVSRLVDLTDTPLGQRIQQLSSISLNPDSSDEIAVSQRFYELYAALDEFEDASPLTWLVGFGGGATIDMKGSRDDSVRAGSILGESRVHNIHFLPVAFFFRHGLIGLALIAYIIVAGLINFRQASRRAAFGCSGGFDLIAATFILQALIEGTAAASHFITNPVVAFCAAYADHARQFGHPVAIWPARWNGAFENCDSGVSLETLVHARN